MYTKSVPLPTPEDLATAHLVAVIESAIGGIQERLANLAAPTARPRSPTFARSVEE